MATLVVDPVLTRFRAALEAIYGDRLARVVLFGSRARGDARADSDYDVAVFLHHPDTSWREARRMAEVTTALLDEVGAVINPISFDVTDYDEPSLLMREIRREGVTV
jgi:predicted nucleotidyltransferase